MSFQYTLFSNTVSYNTLCMILRNKDTIWFSWQDFKSGTTTTTKQQQEQQQNNKKPIKFELLNEI